MPNPMPVTDRIMRRHSCRNYHLKPIEEEKITRLKAFLAENRECPFGTSSRFQLEAAKSDDSSALKGLGTYGMIKGAQAFIIGAVENTEYYPEDYGFLMEKAILYATELGLGSCWLGGTFRKSRFAEKISARGGETIPAVASLGQQETMA
jgi:nitroreductase